MSDRQYKRCQSDNKDVSQRKKGLQGRQLEYQTDKKRVARQTVRVLCQTDKVRVAWQMRIRFQADRRRASRKAVNRVARQPERVSDRQ